MVKKREILGFFLTALFVGFTASGIALINVVYTIAPYTVYGQPITITINVGFVLILLGLLTLALLFRMREK